MYKLIKAIFEENILTDGHPYPHPDWVEEPYDAIVKKLDALLGDNIDSKEMDIVQDMLTDATSSLEFFGFIEGFLVANKLRGELETVETEIKSIMKRFDE